MKHKDLFGKQMLVAVTIAVVGFIAPLQAADTVSDDVLLKTIPADSMFCLRINNFNQSLGKLDQYLAGASPVPMSLAMLVNMQLGAVIGDPMLTGLDQGGDFAVFAIPPQADQTEPSVGILVPLNSYAEFVKTNPNCKPVETGLTLLSPPNSPQGNFLLAPAGDKYALVVHESEKTAMPMLQKALSASSELSKRLSPDQAKEASSAPAWAYLNLAGLNEKYGKDALDALEMSQQQMNQSGQAAGMGEMMDFQIKLLKEMFNTFAADADSATIALAPEATILSLDITFKSKDGSELSKMLSSSTNSSPYTYYNYLDNDLAVNALMKMDGSTLLPFYDKMFDIMEAAADDPTSKEQTAKMKALTKKAFDAMGEEVSVSYSYASGMPPFVMQEVVAIKDVSAMKGMMSEGLDYASTMYKAMGLPIALEYKPAISTHNGTAIDAVLLSVTKSDDPNNMIQQEMAKMYGDDGFEYYIAYYSDKMYITMGADGEKKIKALIDKPSAAATPAGDIKIATDILKSTPFNDFICSINIIKLMKGMGNMVQTMGAQSGMDSNPAMEMFKSLNDAQTQSCLVTGGKVSNGQAALRIALPKQHLLEIVTAAMQIQQKVMMQTQQNCQP